MVPSMSFFVAVLIGGCESGYTTKEVCLDEDMTLMTREGEVHLRDIYNEEDSCEEADGT